MLSWPALTMAVMVVGMLITGYGVTPDKELGGTKIMLFFGFLAGAPCPYVRD